MLMLLFQVAVANPMDADQVLERSNYTIPESSVPLFDQLVQQAKDLELSTKTTWLRLIHYEQKAFGRMVSDQDGEYFFRSADGKTDPQAELEATIKDFLMPVQRFENQNYHPQCMFPARFSWLEPLLNLSELDIPRPLCAELLEWQQDVSLDTVSLAFAGYYEGNPASFFGHTFLLLKSDRAEGKPLYPLVSFGTKIPEGTSSAEMIARGILGLYPGYYALEQYYERIQKYGHKELRNIWEYDLNYSAQEKELLLYHLWELGMVTTFDYFFFTKNCSYQLMTILELPREELNLTAQFSGWVLPAETIRAVQSTPNFVSDVHFRPSLRQAFQDHMETKDLDYRQTLEALYTDQLSIDNLPTDIKTDVMDAALLQIQIEMEAKETTLDELPENTKSLLRARSQIDAPKTISTNPYVVPLPPRGHDLQRLNVFGGLSYEQPFVGIQFRPTVHSAIDPPKSYPFASQQEILVDVRYRPIEQSFYVEQVTLLHLRYFSPPSYNEVLGKGWGIHSQFRRLHFSDAPSTPFENGVTFYKTLPFQERALLFSGVGLALPLSPSFQYWVNVQPSLQMGAVLYANDRFRLVSQTDINGYLIDIIQESKDWTSTLFLRAGLQSSFSISENIGLDLRASSQQRVVDLPHFSEDANAVEIWMGAHYFF